MYRRRNPTRRHSRSELHLLVRKIPLCSSSTHSSVLFSVASRNPGRNRRAKASSKLLLDDDVHDFFSPFSVRVRSSSPSTAARRFTFVPAREGDVLQFRFFVRSWFCPSVYRTPPKLLDSCAVANLCKLSTVSSFTRFTVQNRADFLNRPFSNTLDVVKVHLEVTLYTFFLLHFLLCFFFFLLISFRPSRLTLLFLCRKSARPAPTTVLHKHTVTHVNSRSLYLSTFWALLLCACMNYTIRSLSFPVCTMMRWPDGAEED